MNGWESVNFFRDDGLVADPYPFYDALRRRCPVRREPHHDVVMVTGYDEAVEVFHDSAAFSSCISVTGPFPGFPVPLDGDDVGELIERHRHELPMNDQLPTLDPPVHTAHRALLMKLITPKRLKENEASMWQLADRILDEFLAGGEGEFVSGFAGPFTLLVIADLLGVPEEDREEFLDMLQRRPRSGVIGSTGEDTLTHSPLELLYGRFTAYIEDRRRQPRGDVLTGLATATFPDGSVPEVADVVRVAANLFSAGQETTVRLLSAAVKVLAEQPALQQLLRAERDRIPNFVEETRRNGCSSVFGHRDRQERDGAGGCAHGPGRGGAPGRECQRRRAVLHPETPRHHRQITRGRTFPMVPGVPLSISPVSSPTARMRTGKRATASCSMARGVGETHWGGLAQRARLTRDWDLVPLPPQLHRLARHGDRHGGLHGEPVRGRSAGPWRCPRIESPVKGDFRLSRVPSRSAGWTCPPGPR